MAPASGGEARAPLEVCRSCLRRAQARRARLIWLACCSLPFIPHSKFRTPHLYDSLLPLVGPMDPAVPPGVSLPQDPEDLY